MDRTRFHEKNAGARRRDLGRRLKVARKERGLSLESLASQVGVEPYHVETWERGGRAPRFGYFYELKRALGVSYEYLLDKLGQSTGAPERA